MLQRTREWLTIILIALLPLHALLVTVWTHVISGPGNAPLMMLAVWKEALLGILLFIALIEILFIRRSFRAFLLDKIDSLIVALIVLSVVTTYITHQNWMLYLYGFKYDFVPLVAFLFLRRVEWSETFRYTIRGILIALGAIVSLYGFISLFLPHSFFQLLGYSALHSLYLPGDSIAAFQQIGGLGLRRMQSTMSGPNQLGLWLLIPLGFLILNGIKYYLASDTVAERVLIKLLLREKGKLLITIILILILGAALVLTYSRSAWIGAALIALIAFARHFDKDALHRILIRIGAFILFAGLLIAFTKPEILSRVASSRDHLTRPVEAAKVMVANPFGLGLGSAGPASNRVSDACVHLPADGDASWAADRQDLCVFLGERQVQPEGRECSCPFLPENWYLQIGVELGIMGFVLFILIIFFVIRMLSKSKDYSLGEGVLLGFVGISIVALFLHAWEDSAMTYTLWILTATYVFNSQD